MNSKILMVGKKYKGFTLIEILLVMLITSVLVLGVNTAFKQAHILYSRIEKQRAVYQKSRQIFDTLRAELTGLYMPNTEENQQLAPFSLSALQGCDIRLSFLTLNPSWENSVVSNKPARISYEFATDSDSGQKILMRTEQIFSGEKAIGAEHKKVFFAGLSGFNIMAADPNSNNDDSWKDSLQCRQIPPKAVKILLKWPRDKQTDFEFEIIIKLI